MKMCGYYRLRMFLTLFISCYLLSNIQVVICAQITGAPKDVTISAGMEATFQCIVKLSRDVTEELGYDVAWWTNNINIAAGNNILIQNNRYSVERTFELQRDGKYIYSTLKITKVKHADAGYFTCYIIEKSSIQSLAWLDVKQVPEPECMSLPSSVTTTDVITLSCMIGPGNYVTRLTWYAGDKTDYINTRVFSQTTVKSYLNTTVAITSYENGTIFKCVAEDPNDKMMTETCSTNPLNINGNKPRSLDVKVNAVSLLPLTAGKQACFECEISCGECIGLIQYTWIYDESQLSTTLLNRTCLKNVSANDNGMSLRCIAKFGLGQGTGELVLHVVDNMTTTEIGIDPHDKNDNNLANANDNDPFIPILIVVIIIIILIIFGLLGFIFYRKRKLNARENLKETDEKLDMKKMAINSELQNNQQQNSLSLDATQMYAKVQKVNNLTTEKQNAEKLVPPQNEELNLMYEPVLMSKLAKDKNVKNDISDLYAEVDKNNPVISPDAITHQQSTEGHVYTCVQKNKASTLPPNSRRPASKHLPSTKTKLVQASANQKENSNTNYRYDIISYKNETTKPDKNDGQPENEQPTNKPKNNSKNKVAKQKASTMSRDIPSSGHESMSIDTHGLHYADLEFTNDSSPQSISPQTGGVIYADIKRQ